MVTWGAPIVLVVLGIILIGGICVGDAVWNVKLYGGRNVHCVEDFDAEFNATISSDIVDTMFYFSNSGSGLRFKGTDGRIYICRGIAEID